MTRTEATTRLTEIAAERNAIRRKLNNAVALYKAGELTESDWTELRAREDALNAEFKAVSKFCPSI